MSRELLIAAYETRRILILSNFVATPRLVAPALAFAYDNRLAPIFHEGIAREKYGLDPFEEIYPVGASFMKSLLEFVDRNALNQKLDAIAFEKLEDAFGGYKKHRLEITYTLRYAYLDGRFSPDVFAAIKKFAPAEAYGITEPYTPDDVSFE